jgi:hypothetical protein
MPLRLIFSLLALLSCVTGRAQDFTLTPVAWLSNDDPPDTLPQFDLGTPELPPGLKGYDRHAYAIASISILSNGKLASIRWVGTHPLVEESAAALRRPSRISAAKRAGKSTHSEVWVALILNPVPAGSLSAKGALPRLLRVAPILVETDAQENLPSHIEATLDIGHDGRVVRAQYHGEIPAAISGAADRSLRNWAFVPTVDAGQPKATTVDMLLQIERAPTTVAGLWGPRLNAVCTPTIPWGCECRA